MSDLPSCNTASPRRARFDEIAKTMEAASNPAALRRLVLRRRFRRQSRNPPLEQHGRPELEDAALTDFCDGFNLCLKQAWHQVNCGTADITHLFDNAIENFARDRVAAWLVCRLIDDVFPTAAFHGLAHGNDQFGPAQDQARPLLADAIGGLPSSLRGRR